MEKIKDGNGWMQEKKGKGLQDHVLLYKVFHAQLFVLLTENYSLFILT